MVVINENNEDIYSLIRQNNIFAIRLWIDNITNDIHQRLEIQDFFFSKMFYVLVMNMVLLFYIGLHGMVVYP